MAAMLDGIRVLDLARYVAGPMAAALLADLGADVIRIEPPEGAEDRMPLPFAEGFHGGAGFTQTGRNKRGLSLDIATPEGRAVLDRLVGTADVIVANLPASATQSLGIDYPHLAAIKPDIIYLHLTAFGTTGPYAERLGFDAIAQVMSGLTNLSGDAGRPIKSAAAWVDMASGFLGAFGIMAALRHRDLTGEGQKVEANLFQTALTVGNYFLIEEAFTKIGRTGTGNRAPSGAPADLLPTADGWIYVAVLGNAMFRRFARLIGREDLTTTDTRFLSDEARAEHGQELSTIAAEWSSRHSTENGLALLAQARIPAGPLMTHRQLLSDAHAQECIEHLAVGGLDRDVPIVRHPVIFSKTPASLRKGPPAIGEDSDAILAETGMTQDEIASLRRARII